MRHAYFPTTSIVSLLDAMEDGESTQIASVDNEVVIGMALYMGGETAPNQPVVLSPSHAYRLQRHLLNQEFNRSGKLQHLLVRYSQALLTRMAQTAVCNRHQSLVQLLYRWLQRSLTACRQMNW